MVVLACADEMCPLLFGLKGLDPTCATCAGKPHVLLECRLQLHFDNSASSAPPNEFNQRRHEPEKTCRILMDHGTL